MRRDPLPSPADANAEDRGVLRFMTCGSVDDGKSTLIGRLLYDTRALLSDTLATLERHAERRGLGAPDLSLLTDGLVAEREQGITIDVAYRYFATAQRSFIIADAPGHEQYTRNMVTAASTADVAVLLVDAGKGLLPQTRRHAALAALLGIRHLILAVNKMDRVDWQQARFDDIAASFAQWLAQRGQPGDDVLLQAVPLSALTGDMVVERGANLGWYTGPTLIELLEAAPATQRPVAAPLRLPVQWVCRPSQPGPGSSARGYAGRIEAGEVAVGDTVRVLPSGRTSQVSRIALGEASLRVAVAGQSVLVTLADEVDVSRGDWLVHAEAPLPPAEREFTATLCWLNTAPLSSARSYWLRHTTRELKARVTAVDGRLDVQTLTWHPLAAAPGLNDIVHVRLKTQQPLAFDDYRTLRATGSFILVDEATSETVAGGVIGGRIGIDGADADAQSAPTAAA